MSWPNLLLVCTYVYCKFAMQGFLLFSFKSGRILPIYIGLSQTVTKSSSVAQTSRGTWTEGLSRLPVTSPEHIMLKSLKKKSVCSVVSQCFNFSSSDQSATNRWLYKVQTEFMPKYSTLSVLYHDITWGEATLTSPKCKKLSAQWWLVRQIGPGFLDLKSTRLSVRDIIRRTSHFQPHILEAVN